MPGQDIQDPMSLKEVFQSMEVSELGVIRGKVVSTAPLKIQAENDDKLLIHDRLICLPRHLTSYTANCSISGVTESATIRINNSLQTGESVFILSFNHGKKYYILDREG